MYVPSEDIKIITLNPDQLRQLIYDPAIDKKLCPRLQKVKDIFVIGCTVALRISDLLSLTSDNLQIVDDTYYLMIRSRKTDTVTYVKLPDYARSIIDKLYWLLKKFGKDRGYLLTEKEWRKFIPYPDKEMNKKYKKWQEELKQEVEKQVHLTD